MIRSISSNWSLNALQIMVFMVLTPFAAQALGRETYGIWEVLVASAGPLQLLSLGLPMATVRAVAGRVATSDHDGASHAVGVSLTMTFLLGLVAAVLGTGVWLAFDAGLEGKEEWAHLGAMRADDARLALIILLANVAAGFALALPYALFDAHQDFVARNLIQGGGLLAKLAATVVGLTFHPDLATLAWVQIGIAGLEFLVALTVGRARHPGVRFAPRRLEWTEARSLLSFSVFAFLLNMGALLAFRIDALVIGAKLGFEPAAVYGFGNKMFDPFISLVLGIGMVLMPMAASESAKGNMDDVRDAFLRWSKIAVTIVCLIGGYLMVLGPDFLDAWLGDEYVPASGELLQILMVSFFLFLPVRGVALPVLMGLGRAKWPGIGLLGMGIGNLVLSLMLIGPYGLVGVALGTAIPNVIFSAFFGAAACRALGLPVRRWLSYAAAKVVVAAALSAALLALVSSQLDLAGFPRLIAAGIGYCAVFGVFAVTFIYRDDPLNPLPGRRPRTVTP